MKRFLIGFTVLMFGVVLCLNVSFAALSAVDATMGDDDVHEVNNATPGLSKTFLGTRLKGPTTTGSTTYAAGANGNPVIAQGGSYATPTTTVFLKTTGASTGESYLLGNGTYNQRLTAILITDGGRDFTITPQTTSGFTSVKLDDAKDSVTLKYINSTVGWVVEGNNGATIN